jgi:large subunit ribosomal protein L25
MTTEAIKLELAPRELLGKKVKQLRRAGIIPVHLYGPGIESRPLQCVAPRLIQVLAQAGGNTPILVTVQGETGDQLAFAREIQWDPRRDDVLHVDLLVAELNRPVSAQVPILLTGESTGARSVNGTVMHQLRQLDVEALPLEMPTQFEVDLTALTEPDSVIRVSDLNIPSNVTVLSDSEEVVVRIELPRVEVVTEEAVEEGAESAPSAEED